MKKEVIVACDFNSKKELLTFLDLFNGESIFVKVGMELFYSEGPSIIKDIKLRGHKIFLDLKLHDIPNTVKRTMEVLRNLDVDMVNVHASGTTAMMSAAMEGLRRNDGTRPLLIAVTQLTSTSEERMQSDLLIDKSLKEVVISYAKNAKNAGLDGVVCSAQEAAEIHKHCGDDFITVTPGIRYEDDAVGDQVRIMTPKQAGEVGADYIVVGRTITNAENAVEMYHKCIADFCIE